LGGEKGATILMVIEIEKHVSALVGRKVARPSGQLSGHAGGLPFETLVHKNLLTAYPDRCRRHFEMLNEILLAHPGAMTYDERMLLFGPQAVRGLLMRGQRPTSSWSPTNLFEEKQDDTAETVILEKPSFDLRDNRVTLIDVKSKNLAVSAQPPNIISAGKLAEALRASLEDGEVPFDIVYVGISFRPSDTELECEAVQVVSLFKVSEPLYINWAAAEQIQFHVASADQDFQGKREDWARIFIKNFCDSLESRIGKQEERLRKFRGVI
jgi:type II restriction enzyme